MSIREFFSSLDALTNIEINNIENSDEYGLIFNARVGVCVATMANASSACG